MYTTKLAHTLTRTRFCIKAWALQVQLRGAAKQTCLMTMVLVTELHSGVRAAWPAV